SWSPDSKRLAMAGRGITIWDTTTANRSLVFQLSDFHSVSWSLDGKCLAAAVGDGQVWIVSAATGKIMSRLMGHKAAVRSVACAPDGGRLASASEDGTVKVWDAGQIGGIPLVSPDPRRGCPVPVVAWSPDGTRLAWPSDGTVKIWDATQGNELLAITAHVN